MKIKWYGHACSRIEGDGISNQNFGLANAPSPKGLAGKWYEKS